MRIKNLVKNHCLTLSINDAGWYQFRKWLEYFGVKFGKVTIAVNPAYTYQQCSNCGTLIKKSLSMRTHVCKCGFIYQSQVQKVMETLQKDLPTLFEKDISYDIYTQDIYFQDPVNRFKWKFNYRIIFWTLRFHAQLFFSEIFFDLHDVNQIEEDIIKANWTVRGTLRLPWKARVFFNGDSTYKLTQEGLIYHHLDTWDRKPSEILKQFFRKGD